MEKYDSKRTISKSSLLCYKTILTAQIFLRVFQHTSPLSKYFQTKGLDLLQAQRMTEKTIEKLNNISQEFQVVNKAAQNFTSGLMPS